MAQDLILTCRCGQFRARLAGEALPGGTHLVCYCKDCRAFARHLGAEETLLPGGGSPLYQTTPNHLTIEAGAEHLACLRLGPKGILRWHTTCCNTPIANTMPKPTIPFVGLSRVTVNDADVPMLGPVIGDAFTKYVLPGQGAPTKDRGMGRLFWRFARRALAAYLAGARQSPFFDDAGTPIREPRILSREERRAATTD